jgi:peptidoglycan/xylan/chitin deacetylase (PgdA/CDA1 family)
MEHLAGSGSPIVPLSAVQGSPGRVALTFDDGFLNFFERAFPVLCEFRLPATVFVVSGHCGGKNDWPSQPPGIPALALMGWSQLREITRHGISLGVHTVSHPRLDAIPAADMMRELRECQAEVQQRTGEPADVLCYPYGASNTAVRSAAAECFRAACGTEPACVTPESDPMLLPRIDMYYLRNTFWFRSLGTWRGPGYIGARRAFRGLREAFLRPS